MIVEQFNGKVRVESQVGRGSSFFLSFETSETDLVLSNNKMRLLNQKLHWTGIKVGLATPREERVVIDESIYQMEKSSTKLIRCTQPIDLLVVNTPRDDLADSAQEEAQVIPDHRALQRFQRLLVVDDEPFNLKSMKIVLQSALVKIGLRKNCLDAITDYVSDGQ